MVFPDFAIGLACLLYVCTAQRHSMHKHIEEVRANHFEKKKGFKLLIRRHGIQSIFAKHTDLIFLDLCLVI